MHINSAIDQARGFEDLFHVLENAKPNFSLLGSELVATPDYEGSIDLRVMIGKIARRVKENPDFNERERTFGNRMMAKIIKVDKEYKEELQNFNLLTRMIHFLRSYFIPHYFLDSKFALSLDPGWNGEPIEGDIFKAYTESQFSKVFWCSIREAKKRGFILSKKIYGSVKLGKQYRWEVLMKPKSMPWCKFTSQMRELAYKLDEKIKKTFFYSHWKKEEESQKYDYGCKRQAFLSGKRGKDLEVFEPLRPRLI